MVIPITNSSKENLLKDENYGKIDIILNEPDRYLLYVEVLGFGLFFWWRKTQVLIF